MATQHIAPHEVCKTCERKQKLPFTVIREMLFLFNFQVAKLKVSTEVTEVISLNIQMQQRDVARSLSATERQLCVLIELKSQSHTLNRIINQFQNDIYGHLAF